MTETRQPCGCIVTRHGGHTHTKMCDACRTRHFAPRTADEKPVIYPAVQESEAAWLDT